MKRIAPTRLHRAILNINDWWKSAQTQRAKHLFALLALVEKGVTARQAIPFEEADDFAFWDKYCKVGDGTHPYVDPLTRQRRIKTHPHSNVATARKGTFAASWKAAEVTVGTDGSYSWKFAADFAEKFQKQALIKSGELRRVPVVDLAIWLFKEEQFPDTAGPKELEAEFQKRFKMDAADYGMLFEFKDEATENIFTATTPAKVEYEKAIEAALVAAAPKAPTPRPPTGPDAQATLADDDAVLLQVKELLQIGTSGVIFRGSPGTSKTWYAQQVARALVKDPAKHIFRVQFHPSFGYEDFVEGIKPDAKAPSGFAVVDKTFLKVCDVARSVDTPVVLILDEINRGDPARVLGELLTYIEYGHRNVPFQLTGTGRETSVPHNLLVIGTMNPHDKSITQLDLALIRRFDHIDIEPSTETLADFLEKGGSFRPDQIGQVVEWFNSMQRMLAPMGLGHTYFKDVSRPENLHTIWKYRVWPLCEHMLEFDAAKQDQVKKAFEALYARLTGVAEA